MGTQGHGGSVSVLSVEMITASTPVTSQVWKAVKRTRLEHVSAVYGGVHALAHPKGNAKHTGVIGFLAGLGIGLGIAVPPRRRVTAANA
jgi:hypothetical protein